MTNDASNLKSAESARERRRSEVKGEYDSLDDLKNHVLHGGWTVHEDRIHIADIPYSILPTDGYRFTDILNRQKPAIVIYRQAPHWREKAAEHGLQTWVVLVWRLFNGNVLKPVQVATTKPHTFTSSVKIRTEGVDEQRLVGNKCSIKITSLPNSNEQKALVDTGASMCCLHADKWKIDGQTVSFTNKELSPNVITVPLVTHQATKTADNGTEYRPVIELNIRINGQMLQGVQFNLNNRSSMDCPILLGKNALEKGKFLVDPSMVHESVDEDAVVDVDWASLTEALDTLTEDMDMEGDDVVDKNDIIQQLLDAGISFQDIIAYGRRLEYAHDTNTTEE